MLSLRTKLLICVTIGLSICTIGSAILDKIVEIDLEDKYNVYEKEYMNSLNDTT